MGFVQRRGFGLVGDVDGFGVLVDVVGFRRLVRFLVFVDLRANRLAPGSATPGPGPARRSPGLRRAAGVLPCAVSPAGLLRARGPRRAAFQRLQVLDASGGLWSPGLPGRGLAAGVRRGELALKKAPRPEPGGGFRAGRGSPSAGLLRRLLLPGVRGFLLRGRGLPRGSATGLRFARNLELPLLGRVICARRPGLHLAFKEANGFRPEARVWPHWRRGRVRHSGGRRGLPPAGALLGVRGSPQQNRLASGSATPGPGPARRSPGLRRAAGVLPRVVSPAGFLRVRGPRRAAFQRLQVLDAGGGLWSPGLPGRGLAAAVPRGELALKKAQPPEPGGGFRAGRGSPSAGLLRRLLLPGVRGFLLRGRGLPRGSATGLRFARNLELPLLGRVICARRPGLHLAFKEANGFRPEARVWPHWRRGRVPRAGGRRGPPPAGALPGVRGPPQQNRLAPGSTIPGPGPARRSPGLRRAAGVLPCVVSPAGLLRVRGPRRAAFQRLEVLDASGGLWSPGLPGRGFAAGVPRGELALKKAQPPEPGGGFRAGRGSPSAGLLRRLLLPGVRGFLLRGRGLLRGSATGLRFARNLELPLLGRVICTRRPGLHLAFKEANGFRPEARVWPHWRRGRVRRSGGRRGPPPAGALPGVRGPPQQNRLAPGPATPGPGPARRSPGLRRAAGVLPCAVSPAGLLRVRGPRRAAFQRLQVLDASGGLWSPGLPGRGFAAGVRRGELALKKAQPPEPGGGFRAGRGSPSAGLLRRLLLPGVRGFLLRGRGLPRGSATGLRFARNLELPLPGRVICARRPGLRSVFGEANGFRPEARVWSRWRRGRVRRSGGRRGPPPAGALPGVRGPPQQNRLAPGSTIPGPGPARRSPGLRRAAGVLPCAVSPAGLLRVRGPRRAAFQRLEALDASGGLWSPGLPGRGLAAGVRRGELALKKAQPPEPGGGFRAGHEYLSSILNLSIFLLFMNFANYWVRYNFNMIYMDFTEVQFDIIIAGF
ncbi:Hypothetical_protein [Hexamita inflata]|uniref:Hypothetical_protein n=1 Tax=Hexamita inflata TaxID=28002 RepID=A0AA86TXF6_9EUKA|nr:Hypothetical protein HINF_LOCUS712 [Hexamita inflata]CAI9924613.1 Hypothetical protein HINF_LOCUS12258 [Hexamita inflata]CAI9967256.1 Hypothetical protein HINF_LOCUS54901 [Hexamita inflata]